MTKKLFYFLSFTWGLPMTLCGLIVSVALIATKHKPRKWGWSWCFEVGNGSGGFSCGPFFFVPVGTSDVLKDHEFGHGIQNARLGPMMVLLTTGSVIRFWYREIFGAKTTYNSWWFEGEASKLGSELIERLNEK